MKESRDQGALDAPMLSQGTNRARRGSLRFCMSDNLSANVGPPRSLSLRWRRHSYHAANAERTERIACSRGRARRAPRSEVSEARDRSGP
jgi:hypothetical protein